MKKTKYSNIILLNADEMNERCNTLNDYDSVVASNSLANYGFVAINTDTNDVVDDEDILEEIYEGEKNKCPFTFVGKSNDFKRGIYTPDDVLDYLTSTTTVLEVKEHPFVKIGLMRSAEDCKLHFFDGVEYEEISLGKMDRITKGRREMIYKEIICCLNSLHDEPSVVLGDDYDAIKEAVDGYVDSMEQAAIEATMMGYDYVHEMEYMAENANIDYSGAYYILENFEIGEDYEDATDTLIQREVKKRIEAYKAEREMMDSVSEERLSEAIATMYRTDLEDTVGSVPESVVEIAIEEEDDYIMVGEVDADDVRSVAETIMSDWDGWTKEMIATYLDEHLDDLIDCLPYQTDTIGFDDGIVWANTEWLCKEYFPDLYNQYFATVGELDENTISLAV